MASISRARMVKIKFKPPINCSEIRIAGDFTDWEKGAIVMSKATRSGEWMASVRLAPGRSVSIGGPKRGEGTIITSLSRP